MIKHQSSTATEIQHRVAVMEEEKQHMRQLLRIEESISKAKIDALVVVEEAAREEMALLEQMAKDSDQLIKVQTWCYYLYSTSPPLVISLLTF